MDYPVIPRFADAIVVKHFPTGQNRVVRDPPAYLLRVAFEKLGTHVAVAGAFGVTRRVVSRWLRESGVEVVSRPEVRYAESMRQRLKKVEDQERTAQWLMDEGSVSVAYSPRTDHTILLVCGSMNDYAVLSKIGEILGVQITSSNAPAVTTLPMGAVRVQGPRAYATLRLLRPRLMGLKGMEADEALRFFPPSGGVGGRHTTDEFLTKTWRDYAKGCYSEWNKRRRIKSSRDDMERLAAAWVEGRIRRARRFIDRPPR